MGIALVGIVHDQSGGGKQQAGDQTVADHLHRRAYHTNLSQRENTQQNKAHVADTAVCDQSFNIRLL